MRIWLPGSIGLIVAAVFLQAQTTITPKTQMFQSASPYTLSVEPEPLTGNVTVLLPATGGTLVSSTPGGVSTTWLLGGNDLAGPGPSDNRLGSTTAQDVRLIAGGGSNTRLTLLNSINVIEVNGGELRFVESAGTKYSAFKAGSQTQDITYTLPVDLPTLYQNIATVSVSGTNAQLGGRTGAHASNSKTTADQSTSSTSFIDVNSMSVTLEPNKVYHIKCYLRANHADGNSDMDVQFVPPADATVWVSYQRLEGSVAAFASLKPGFIELTAIPISLPTSSSNIGCYVLRGYVKTGTTGGTLQLQYRHPGTGTSTTVQILENSFMYVVGT